MGLKIALTGCRGSRAAVQRLERDASVTGSKLSYGVFICDKDPPSRMRRVRVDCKQQVRRVRADELW